MFYQFLIVFMSMVALFAFQMLSLVGGTGSMVGFIAQVLPSSVSLQLIGMNSVKKEGGK